VQVSRLPRFFWKDNNIDTGMQLQLLKACIFSVLIFTAETWTIVEDAELRLLAFEMR